MVARNNKCVMYTYDVHVHQVPNANRILDVSQ